MHLRRQPTRPMWKPMYLTSDVRIGSWSKFVSEVYWSVELDR
jgi:hypothetical protein